MLGAIGGARRARRAREGAENAGQLGREYKARRLKEKVQRRYMEVRPLDVTGEGMDPCTKTRSRASEKKPATSERERVSA